MIRALTRDVARRKPPLPPPPAQPPKTPEGTRGSKPRRCLVLCAAIAEGLQPEAVRFLRGHHDAHLSGVEASENVNSTQKMMRRRRSRVLMLIIYLIRTEIMIMLMALVNTRTKKNNNADNDRK